MKCHVGLSPKCHLLPLLTTNLSLILEALHPTPNFQLSPELNIRRTSNFLKEKVVKVRVSHDEGACIQFSFCSTLLPLLWFFTKNDLISYSDWLSYISWLCFKVSFVSFCFNSFYFSHFSFIGRTPKLPAGGWGPFLLLGSSHLQVQDVAGRVGLCLINEALRSFPSGRSCSLN